MQLGGLGERCPGSGAEPQRKSDFTNFSLKINLTSGGTNFTYFIAEKCSILSYFRVDL